MAYKTFSDLIQATVKELSQVSGTGVQLYAEDIIGRKLQSSFNMVFDELWWDQYMEWFQRTLDGTTGVVTSALTGVTRFDDIRAVFVPQSHTPLPYLPRDFQPFVLTGTQPRFIEALTEDEPTKIIQFWPKTATGTIYIHARKKPDDFNLDDLVKLDPDVLIFGAAWDYLESDGTVPADAQKMQVKFEARLKQLKKNYGNKPIALDPQRTQNIPLDWMVMR